MRSDSSNTRNAPPRAATTMRIQQDIRDAVDVLRERHGMSRTQYVEQVLAKHIRSEKGHPPIRLKSVL